MSIEIRCYKKNLTKMLDDLFKSVDERKRGYGILIPLGTNHITINGVVHHFHDNEYAYLWYNHYGQMDVEILQGNKLNNNPCESWNTRLHISWTVKDLTELWITAPNKYGDINPKTNDYYNELFVFKIN